jgi:hypothetical protein
MTDEIRDRNIANLLDMPESDYNDFLRTFTIAIHSCYHPADYPDPPDYPGPPTRVNTNRREIEEHFAAARRAAQAVLGTMGMQGHKIRKHQP